MKKFDSNSILKAKEKVAPHSALPAHRKQILSAVHKPRSGLGFDGRPSSREEKSWKTFAFSFIIKHSGNVPCCRPVESASGAVLLRSQSRQRETFRWLLVFHLRYCFHASQQTELIFCNFRSRGRSVRVFICLFTVETSFSASRRWCGVLLRPFFAGGRGAFLR